MKKNLILSIALLSLTFTNAQNWKKEKIKENGNQTTITRTIDNYDKISAGGSFKVELISGKEGNITIAGDENIINNIITEVVDNTLKIHFDKNKNYSYGSKITITVPFEEISEISFAGSGEIITKNTIKATNFKVNFTGSGDGEIDVIATKIVANLSGSGDLNIKGTTTDLEASVVGSGEMSCGRLDSQNGEVSVTGSGELRVNCTTELTAKVTGSGTIKYKGKPNKIDKNIAGSGNISSF